MACKRTDVYVTSETFTWDSFSNIISDWFNEWHDIPFHQSADTCYAITVKWPEGVGREDEEIIAGQYSLIFLLSNLKTIWWTIYIWSSETSLRRYRIIPIQHHHKVHSPFLISSSMLMILWLLPILETKTHPSLHHVKLKHCWWR